MRLHFDHIEHCTGIADACCSSAAELCIVSPVASVSHPVTPRRHEPSRCQAAPAETTGRLLDAAVEEFVERGYEGAVISNIARRAGMTTGAVYARWAGKNDMLVAALDHVLEQLLPDRRIREFGLDELPVRDVMETWGASLLTSDETKDILVQLFGSARSSPDVEVRLQRFLNTHADQLSRLADRAVEEGFLDPELSTVATTRLIQAIGVGAHLLLSAGLEEHHHPSEQEWMALLVRLVSALRPLP